MAGGQLELMDCLLCVVQECAMQIVESYTPPDGTDLARILGVVARLRALADDLERAFKDDKASDD